MNILQKTIVVILTAIFIFTNCICVFAGASSDYAKDDYRDKPIYNIYGNIVNKPKAKFVAKRTRGEEFISSVQSYEENNLNIPFHVLECYVGDTLTFEDFSYDVNGGSIIGWDWQYYGHLGDSHREYSYNILNQSSFYLETPGETTFFLCVKSDVKPKKGTCDPWSDNGNHQTIGKNKWFPKGMYWYFTAVRVIVHPAVEAKVHVRRWDVQRNTIFNEGTMWLGQLQGNNATMETSVNISDWEGYEYHGWNVMLPDGTVQYNGTERDVGITLASWLPEKYLNIEYFPYMNTEVRIRYWDSGANRIMYEESKYGEKVVKDNETTVAVNIPDWDGYEFIGWNVQLQDGTQQYNGITRNVNVTLNGYVPFKYLNIEYRSNNGGNGGGNTPEPTPTNPPDIPEPPEGICDGEITWTETDSHRVRTGYDRKGNPEYENCNHTFTYKAVLSAIAVVTPEKFKSGYGFELTVNCDIKTTLVSNTGDCSNWGNEREPVSIVKNPAKATVYIPWTMTNRLGTQSQAIVMDVDATLKFRLPVSPVSESGARKIYTDISLAGTKEEPVTHYFDIYISGGGVGETEFCKKITKSITINGDLYEDDFSGAD